MKRILAIFLVLSLFLPCFAFADEDVEELRTVVELYHEDDPSRRITFTHPAKYESRVTYAFSTTCYCDVYYDDLQYVEVQLLPADMERVSHFENNYVLYPSRKLKNTGIATLTDQMCAVGTFRLILYTGYDPFDMVEVGITLDNGYYIKVQSLCYAGQITGCYDLLLDVLGNFVDTDVVAAWLEETWYPQVLAQGDQ